MESKTLEGLSRDEKSLLLYLETRAVDFNGRVDTRHMNEDGQAIAKRWNTEGFVEWGRIIHADCNTQGSMWCKLSDNAWDIVKQLRKDRAVRGFDNRVYTRTCDED